MMPPVQIVHADGLAGAASARGLVVVIDVLRAFTVSAYALAGGARECLLVASVEEALTLSSRIPGSVVSAEIEGLPVPGIEISNSPTLLLRHDLRGRTLVQRTSAGTQGVAAATRADAVLAASLVVARPTALAIRDLRPELVSLVAMGMDLGHPEDRACALYIEGLVREETPPLERLLEPLLASPRYSSLRAGEVPGFPPSDLDLALPTDRFDFAMSVHAEGDGVHRLTRLIPSS